MQNQKSIVFALSGVRPCKLVERRRHLHLAQMQVSALQDQSFKYHNDLWICASISSMTPSSTLNHLIFGSDSLNQFACLRTKTLVARRISTFACASLNSPLTTRMHSRYPIADSVGRVG